MHTFCHIELITTNLEQSAQIYKELFGWQIAPMMENYWMINIEGSADGVSGALLKVEKIVDNGGQNYVEVGDVNATLAQAEKLGAKVVQEKRPLPENMGFIGMFAMPDGYLLGVFSKQ